MRTHTSDFKNEIKRFGRELDSKITYGTTELGKEQLNSVTPHYESSLLKSVMKQLDIDSNVEIPLETVINYQFGVKVGNSYEYLNYGNYVVYKVEKQEDTRSWKITCYDKMLYAMKDYESLGITYPITVKNFLSAICTKLGLTLASDDFVNANKEITSELYLDSEGNSLGYTYRDVLDELSQVVAGIICINNDDEVEVRYPSNAGTYETVEGTFLHLDNVDDSSDLALDLNGNTVQDGTPSPDSPVDIETVTGRQEIDVVGKNLFDVDGNVSSGTRVKYEDYGLTFTKNVNRVCRIDLPLVVPAGTYTISMDKISSTLSGDNKFSIGLMLYTSSVQTIQPLVDGTFTTISSFNQLYFFINSDQSDSATITIDNIQLEKGSTATNFESCTVNSYEINLGKNLFDGIMEQGTFNAQGEKTGNNYRVRSTNFTTIKNEDIYCFSLKNNNDYNIVVYVYDTAGNFISEESTTTWRNIPLLKTIKSNRKIKFAIKYKSGNSVPITPSEVDEIQVERSNGATPYSPYKTPIELCKIGNYKDYIAKGTGKNLFNINEDYDSIYGCTKTINGNTLTQTNTGVYSRTMWKIENLIVGEKYTLSYNFINASGSSLQPRILDSTNTNIIENGTTTTTTSGTSTLTFTATETTHYIRLYSNTTNTSNTAVVVFYNIQLEESSTATSYEPYGFKDKWYLHKKIGKVILNGSETWTRNSSSSYERYYHTISDAINTNVRNGCISNYFKYSSSTNVVGNCFINSSRCYLYPDTTITTSNDFKTWLSTHNTIVYYPLATPTTTEITDTELLGQLEAIRLQLGINNISVDSNNLSSPLKLTYLSELETIDEEMLKDVNVNFGEVFGEVNSVVLSRSAESDNIYRKDDESIEENGLTEIKIKDNQILNGNNRDEFIDGIFDKLKGLKYYVNDYVSTGIGYLELGDFYKVKVEDNYYKCLMLNDELDVTQGLEEPIHAEGMEDSETDYTKADKTDRKINQAYIIVDKQNQEINSVVQNVSTLQTLVNSQGEQIDSLGTRITQNIDSITASVSSIQSELNNGVGLVKTTSVIINDEGLTVATDTSKTTTTMTSEKFKVSSGGKDLAYFGYDDELGSTKAEMSYLTVDKYFVAGHHRIETYDTSLEQRTGVFYIGE